MCDKIISVSTFALTEFIIPNIFMHWKRLVVFLTNYLHYLPVRRFIFPDGLPIKAPNTAKNKKLKAINSFKAKDISLFPFETANDSTHTAKSMTAPLASPGRTFLSPDSLHETIPEAKEDIAIRTHAEAVINFSGSAIPERKADAPVSSKSHVISPMPEAINMLFTKLFPFFAD